MENLNAEQVKKGLECCAAAHSSYCRQCPVDVKKQEDCECGTFLAGQALALINSQEQRIKELAEERDGFENLVYTAIETQNRMSDTIENLTEENERLRAESVAIPEGGIGNLSDGYHTFNELYHHRAILFSVICNGLPDNSWKSKLHDTGDMYDGMFIVGIETPEGQATYHYDIEPYWDMFKVKELEKAPKWDGHTPQEAIERIAKLNIGVIKLWENLLKAEAQEVPIKAARADTVRKMQERLKEKVFSVPTVYNAHFGRMIDQIAKEMLEGENERQTNA